VTLGAESEAAALNFRCFGGLFKAGDAPLACASEARSHEQYFQGTTSSRCVTLGTGISEVPAATLTGGRRPCDEARQTKWAGVSCNRLLGATR
jgi:hypothetical protein